MNATYIKRGFGKGDRVEAQHGEWTVTLDTYTVSTGKTVIVFTRMRAPYVNPDGFRFSISRRGFFSGIAKFFGMQDIEIGDEPFDTDFIIQANDEFKVKQLLANTTDPRVARRSEGDPVQGRRTTRAGVDRRFRSTSIELQFMVGGVIKDIDRLKELYELFAETLDEFCRIGSAYEGSPGVKL